MRFKTALKILYLLGLTCVLLVPKKAPAKDGGDITAFKLRGTIFLQSKIGSACDADTAPSSVVTMLLVQQGDLIYTTSYGLRRTTVSDNSAIFKFQPGSNSTDIKSLKTKLVFKKLHLNKVPAVFRYTTVYQDNSSCQLVYKGSFTKKDAE
jgi:hypothetical protein